MHDQRDAGNGFLNGGDAVKMQALPAGELVCAVGSADGAGQAVGARALNELFSLVRVGQEGIFLVYGNVFLHTAQHSQFRLDADTLGVGVVYDAARDGDIFVEGIVRGVNHH